MNDSDIKIKKRIHLIANIENIIKESVYYRTHSSEFKNDRIEIKILNQSNIQKKII